MSGTFVEPGIPYERIGRAFSAHDRLPHEVRYHLAAGFLQHDDRVVDAACGTGHGAPILERRGRIHYLGVERDLSVLEVESTPERTFEAANLEVWGGPPTPFDVAVCLETVEHLHDPSALRDWTLRARRYVVVSVPIVPTMGGNPYHTRDYRPGEILTLWRNMRPVAFFEQPAEGTGIWVFGQW